MLTTNSGERAYLHTGEKVRVTNYYHAEDGCLVCTVRASIRGEGEKDLIFKQSKYGSNFVERKDQNGLVPYRILMTAMDYVKDLTSYELPSQTTDLTK